MIFFRKYEQGDIWEVMTKDILTQLGYGIDEEYIDIDYTWTLVDDIKILGCAGFRLYWYGVYEAWLHPKDFDTMNKYKYMVIRKIRQEIKKLPAHRIQTTIADNLTRNIKFIKVVGFKYEALLHKYGPKQENYLVYSIVR